MHDFGRISAALPCIELSTSQQIFRPGRHVRRIRASWWWDVRRRKRKEAKTKRFANILPGDAAHWQLVREGLKQRRRSGLGSTKPTACIRRCMQLRFSPPRSRVYSHARTVITRLECRAVRVSCPESQVGGQVGGRAAPRRLLRSGAIGQGRRIGQRRLPLPATGKHSHVRAGYVGKARKRVCTAQGCVLINGVCNCMLT